MRKTRRLLRRFAGGILSREALEALGFAVVSAGFYEAMGQAAGLWAVGCSLLYVANFGGRR